MAIPVRGEKGERYEYKNDHATDSDKRADRPEGTGYRIPEGTDRRIQLR